MRGTKQVYEVCNSRSDVLLVYCCIVLTYCHLRIGSDSWTGSGYHQGRQRQIIFVERDANRNMSESHSGCGRFCSCCCIPHSISRNNGYYYQVSELVVLEVMILFALLFSLVFITS